jgi:hypothetical protein
MYSNEVVQLPENNHRELENRLCLFHHGIGRQARILKFHPEPLFYPSELGLRGKDTTQGQVEPAYTLSVEMRIMQMIST